MTHDELCVRARRWLSGTCRCNPVYSRNASCDEIPDAIGWTSKWRIEGSIVVECKTSVSDFYADRRKYFIWKHREHSWRYSGSRMSEKQAEEQGFERVPVPSMGDRRYYFCEPGVITPELVEKHAPDHGLIYRVGVRVNVVREAPKRENVNKDAEIRYLRFAIINNKQAFSMPVVEEATQVEM